MVEYNCIFTCFFSNGLKGLSIPKFSLFARERIEVLKELLSTNFLFQSLRVLRALVMESSMEAVVTKEELEVLAFLILTSEVIRVGP